MPEKAKENKPTDNYSAAVSILEMALDYYLAVSRDELRKDFPGENSYYKSKIADTRSRVIELQQKLLTDRL